MIVAQLRGAKFWSGNCYDRMPKEKNDWKIAGEAVKDVSKFLGYTTTKKYLTDLGLLKSKIFNKKKVKHVK